MVTIKELWKEGELYKQGVVELVPTEWVWKYRGRDVSPQADLKDGTPVTLQDLWDNIVSEGLHDPLIMRLGVKSKTFRLEAGNHRIQVFHEHGVPMIPVTVHVQEECGPHASNPMNDGSHNFDASEEALISEIQQTYMRPSDVFKSLK